MRPKKISPAQCVRHGFVRALEAEGWEVWTPKRGETVCWPRGFSYTARSEFSILARRRSAADWHSADYEWMYLDLNGAGERVMASCVRECIGHSAALYSLILPHIEDKT